MFEKPSPDFWTRRGTLQEVGPGVTALVSSFGTESAALLKVMADVDPAIPVIFLDTGWLFEETLAELTGMSIARVVGIVHDRRGFGFRALYEKAGLPNSTYPIFREAEKVIADPVVRNKGTMGGSMCQADPSEDLSAVGSALKQVRITTSSGDVSLRLPASVRWFVPILADFVPFVGKNAKSCVSRASEVAKPPR